MINGKIHLTGMVFYGHHGDIAEERALGQRFMVDLVLTSDMTEVIATDELYSTVDYVGVYALCQEVMEKAPVKLLETLAARLGEKILAAHPLVSAVNVVVKKPAVPIRGALDYVAVELTLNRGPNSLPRTGQ